MGITTTRLESLSILDRIILIATASLDRRQHHSRS